MDDVDDLIKSNFSTLFDWDSIEKCENSHILNATKYVCRILLEFNEICKEFYKLSMEKKMSDARCAELLNKNNESDTCEKCSKLQGKLNNQSKQIKEILMRFEQNNTESVDLPIRAASDPILQMTKKEKEDEDICIIKNENSVVIDLTTKQDSENLKSESFLMEEIEETFVNEPCSPVLRKCKPNKINRRKQDSSLNLNRSEDKESSEESSPNKENTCIQLSPSVLLNHDVKKISDIKMEITTPIKNADKTLGLSKKSRKLPMLDLSRVSSKSKKCTKNKGFKQSRLRFSNSKAKLSLDISRTSEFLGGIRGSPICTNDQDDSSGSDFKMTKPVNERIDDLSDTIDESPSCITRKQIHKNRIKLRLNPNKSPDNQPVPKTIKDDDETMLFTVPQNVKSPKKGLDLTEQVPTTSKQKSKSPKDFKTPSKRSVLDVVYKEEPLRKKIDKANAPGWSCKKCEDFYKVAFKGDDEMIKKKVQECSKHRGKFNPVDKRYNTPPGFWDVNMPPTPDV